MIDDCSLSTTSINIARRIGLYILVNNTNAYTYIFLRIDAGFLWHSPDFLESLRDSRGKIFSLMSACGVRSK